MDTPADPADASPRATEAAIRSDPGLSEAQKEALTQRVPELPAVRAGGAVDPRLLRGRRLSRMM